MPPLPGSLRTSLERTVVAARKTAEEAAQAVLTTLAVGRDQPFATLSGEQRRLRRGLRTLARQLGGGDQSAGMALLREEIAYQQWHRLLFTRFLAENGLLIHPEGVPVSLEECAELARSEGADDGWELAASYTARMLPGLFEQENPAVQVRLAPEHRHALQQLVRELPAVVFTADDSLGWAYQFWQSVRKQEINRSGRKIGAGDIGPVTQLFTDDYIVRFLLENSLGAWWAVRHPTSPLIKTFTYLRFRDDGTPAAGTFPGWPDRAADVTVMDPCGGSGHFIVVAFDMLRRMRMEEEGLSEAAAGDAVIRDNLFMLEIDPRCTQIATFALLLAVWKAGGYRTLPLPNIACSGIAVEGQLEDWLRLADGDERQRRSLERLYNLFRLAPTLGSLIDPTHVPAGEQMFSADYDEVAPLVERALERERRGGDPASLVLGRAALAVARAARLLAGRYTLVATNVPYLVRGKQSDMLKNYCSVHHPAAAVDLATVFVERCLTFAAHGGTCALVTPQNWLFLGSYRKLRERLLSSYTLNHISPLGPRSFEAVGGEVVNVALCILTNAAPQEGNVLTGVEADAGRAPADKARLLREGPLQVASQAQQLANPDARLALGSVSGLALLSAYALALQGIATADYARFGRCFWEVPLVARGWSQQQSTVKRTTPYGGREHILWWENGAGALARCPQARVQGLAALGRRGVAVSQMRDLTCTVYTGELFDNNVAVIVPHSPEHLPAIWAFCSSPEFAREVRRIDKKLNVTNATLVKVPFDLERWQKVAEEAGPLPEPYSNDPTQWLFEGNPVGSAAPLQVAVARLLGYRWPQQKPDALDAYADRDGIVCLPPVAGEQPAAERLRALLAAAYGDRWSPSTQQRLLAEVGFGDRDLADWLRDGFFAQHCRLFHNRPFIWHIWDGRRDGFSALVNYHRLDGPTLEKLIYTCLGQWIEAQRAERDRGVRGADGRLVAALELKSKLEAIRTGEAPCDIYVRWKPIHQQPIGWEPDLNDGVRLNIRPFVHAGVLRCRFSINWNKDRGRDPDGSERINDRHLTLAEKRAARERSGG